MSDQSKQHISELMDGELSRDCSRFLLKRMNHDTDFRRSWSHYHLMRSGLQQDQQAPLMSDLGARVVQRLQNEKLQPNKEINNRPNWFKAMAGTAIAASVALVAVLSFNQNNPITVNSPLLASEFTKTSKQLINPPSATVARVEQTSRYSRYPDVTPQIQHYLLDQNTQQMVPVYYRVNYLQRPQNQLSVPQVKAYTEE